MTFLFEYDIFNRVTKKVEGILPEQKMRYTSADNNNLVIHTTSGNKITEEHTTDGMSAALYASGNKSREGFDITYYDKGVAKGRVKTATALTSNSGPGVTTTYEYNNLYGKLTRNTHTVGNEIYSVTRQYDSDGELVGMGYPSGLHIEYQRDPATKKVTAIKVSGNYNVAIASNISLGNGETIQYTYSTNYRVKAINTQN
jgi:hypothetical protein